MRPRVQSGDEQVRVTAYGHIIRRYLRYVLIRCTGYSNDKGQVQRMAVYALVTACLLFDKLSSLGELGSLVEMMVKIVGEDPVPELSCDARCEAYEREAVFVLDGRMCEVAGAINALEQASRELLVLRHVEGLEIVALADARGVTAEEVRAALAAAEGEFVELLRGLSSWTGTDGVDVHGLLAEFAGCLDLYWANDLGVFALQYAAQWKG